MSSKKNTAATKTATAKAPATAPATTGATETVQVTGKVVGDHIDDALQTEEINKKDNPTASALLDLNEQAGNTRAQEINTDKKTSDADLPQSRGSVTKTGTRVTSEDVGNPENKTTHEISGKLVYETAADYQASLKKDK